MTHQGERELILKPWQRVALQNLAIEAEQTQNPLLRTVDMENRWSRILSVNCGFE